MTPSSARCSNVTSSPGSNRTRSTSRRPGTTTAPSPSICASSDERSDSSMSVAARWRRPPSARRSTPERIWTVARVETARETIPSFCATAEFLADLGQRRVGELAREIHRDLAGIDDVLRAFLATELVHRQLEALRDELLDTPDGDLRGFALREHVFQHVLGELHGEGPSGERGERDDPRQRAFQLTDVRGDARGDERQDLWVGDVDAVRLGLLAEDRDPRLEIGGLDVGD